MDIKINDSPVRTSRNFGINNIRLNDIEIPENLNDFKNVKVIKNISKITSEVQNKNLVYGIGNVLKENNFKYSNNKIRIETENEDIRINYDFDDDNLNLINQIEIIGNKNSNIIIRYKSNTNRKCFHNGVIKVIAKENCKLNVFVINLLNELSENFECYENELYNNSEINYTIIDLGGKYSISNYYSNILGKNASNDLKTIYFGKDNEIKDLNYIAELKGKNSKIDIDVQGALDGECRKNFKGTIDFKKGCKKAKGNENEFCLLLSDKAKSIALPMLLCTEDDVEGNHSTASGKVDAKNLFYLMSRGLSYKDAVKLIVKSNFNKIIERITDEEIKKEVLKEIDRRLV